MKRARRRGPGPSHLLMTPDRAGNVVGVDPHKRTLTATVADARGGILASEHFRVSGEGHRELEAWARQFGQIARWGIEGSASWGRHTAVFLVARGHDVRDVCANRTPRADRARRRGKSDMLDSERIAREVLAHPLLPKAFKRSGQEQGPDELHQLLALWHNRRRSILTTRQHLVTRRSTCCASCRWGSQSSCPTPRRSSHGSRRRHGATAAGATTRRLSCVCNCSTAIARRSRRWTSRRSRWSRSSRSSLTAAARPSASYRARASGRSPNSWSRSATPGLSPRAGSHASTAQRR